MGMVKQKVMNEPVSVPDRAAHGLDSLTLESIVDELCAIEDGATLFVPGRRQHFALPSRDAVEDVVESLRSILFPGYFGPSELTTPSLRYYLGSTLDKAFRKLKDQVGRGLCFVCVDHPGYSRCLVCENQAEIITNSFMSKLPLIRRVLATDIKAAYEGDPAATSPYETIFSYPGVFAITNFRIAHELFELGVPLIPRIITEQAHGRTGIDIHPGAVIGEGFFIDHGTGVVIGETCRIGRNVRLYQGVTLGAKSFALDQSGRPVKGIARHPIVEDDVIVYSEATILGRVVIGRGSVIGGNVWLTRSVPPNSRIVQMQARQESYQDGAGI
jgi:serine O-acetyltransferase